MASFDLLVVEGGKQKRRSSSAQTIDFAAIRLGSSNLLVKETGGKLDLGSTEIVTTAAPSSDNSVVTKSYVDSLGFGLRDFKESVRVLATSNVPLTGGAALQIDGVFVQNGNRILLNGQNSADQNGIYVVSGIGTAYSLTRASDANQNSGVSTTSSVSAGMFCFVEEGDTYYTSGWVLSTQNPIVLGTSSLVFVQFSGAGMIVAGNGLTKNGNVIDANPSDASITVGADGFNVTRDPAGAIALGNSGIKVNLELINPSLQIATNQLGVKLDGAGAVVAGASGVGVNVDGSSLAISTNALTLKIKSGAPLAKDVNGVSVTVDGRSVDVSSSQLVVKTDPASVLSKSDLGLSVGVDNDTVQVSSNSLAVKYTKSVLNSTGSSIGSNKLVSLSLSGTDIVGELSSRQDSSLWQKSVGITASTISNGASGPVVVRRGAIVGGFTGLDTGKKYYVNASGNIGLYSDISYSEGEIVYSVGRAYSPTELVFDPQFEFEY
ncbi:MAG: hypothetical protein EBZ49_00825 [Proteobacteria bacterium]|nr:hypothetical protein [Pseudomonadota bacterium]